MIGLRHYRRPAAGQREIGIHTSTHCDSAVARTSRIGHAERWGSGKDRSLGSRIQEGAFTVRHRDIVEGVVTAKERLRQLVDELSEAEAAEELKLWSARRNGLVTLMDSAPLDEEPFTDEDEAALAESLDELAQGGQTVSVDEFRRQG